MPPGGVLPKGDNYHYLLIQIGIVRCFRPQSFRYLSFRLLSLSIQNTANIHNMRASSSEGSRPLGVNCSCLFMLYGHLAVTRNRE